MKTKQRIELTTLGLTNIIVCASKESTRKQVKAYANRHYARDSKWRVYRGEPKPCDCASKHEDCLHYRLACPVIDWGKPVPNDLFDHTAYE